jgi:small GTP-binding protein
MELLDMYDATFKIVIFGDAGTGKEVLTQRFLTNLFVSDSKMTIGVDFEVKSLVVDGKNVKLQIWDFGGEERFRFLLPTYVRGARGGIFVYDITNYSSIAHIDDWLTVIRREIKAEDQFPIIVVGSKAHLAEFREVSAEEGIKIARSRGVDGFIEVSDKTGENVEKMFEALTGLMLDSEYAAPREPGVKPDVSDEIGLEQVKKSAQAYVIEKSETNKQITRARTIEAIKKSLKLTAKDRSWDDIIWNLAISLSKPICTRISDKTIYFQQN